MYQQMQIILLFALLPYAALLLQHMNFEDNSANLKCMHALTNLHPTYKIVIYAPMDKGETALTKLVNDLAKLLTNKTVEIYIEDHWPSVYYMVRHDEILLFINDDTKIASYFGYSLVKRKRALWIYLYLGTKDIADVFKESVYRSMAERALIIQSGKIYKKHSYHESCGVDSYEYVNDCNNIESKANYFISDGDYKCDINIVWNPVILPFTHFHLKFEDTVFPQIELKLLQESARAIGIKSNYKTVYDTNPYDIQIGALGFSLRSKFYPRFVDEIVLIAPKPKRIAAWKSMLYIFSPQLWQTICLASSVYLIASGFIIVATRSAEGYKNFSFTLLQFFAIFIGQNACQPNRPLMRIIFICWVLFSFVIINAYCSFLLSCLLKPNYPQLLTLKDILNHTYICSGSSDLTFLEFIEFKENKLFLRLCNTDDISDIANAVNTVYKYTRSEFDALNKIIEDFHLKVYAVKAFTYPLNIYSAYDGEGMVQKLDKINGYLVEAGFTEKWYRDVKNETYIKIDDFTSLGMDHLWLAFYILITGLTVSVVIFCIELLYDILE